MKSTLLYTLLFLPLASFAQINFGKESIKDSSFESSMIRKLGIYYNRIIAPKPGDEIKEQERKDFRHELILLRQGLTSYYLLSGEFPSALLPKTALDDSSQLKLTNSTITLASVAGSGGTLLSQIYSPNGEMFALATPTTLIVRRVNNGAIVGKPIPVTNPAYCFSKENELYVVDQLNPSQLKRIDAQGKESAIPLPDSLARLGYRIDQILPDSGLVVARRVSIGRTLVSVWNFVQKKSEFAASFNSPISNSRLEPLQTRNWLLAAYQADKQAYTLLLNQGGRLTQLPIGLVSEYKTIPDSLKLVALQTDNSLVLVDLESEPQSHTISTNARYFDWKGDTLVYWKRRDSVNKNKWALYMHNFKANTDQTGFWYDTDLRRDVPRIKLQYDKKACPIGYVYFEDRSNNTANEVCLDKLVKKP